MENFKSAVDAFLRNELERDELARQLEQAIKQTPTLSTQILSHLTDLHQADSLSMEDYSVLNSRLKSFSSLSRPSQWEDDDDTAIEPGLVILDKYRLVEELGKGGMGVVWKAIDLIQEAGEARDSHVAIKFLSQDFKQHPDALKALVREFNRYGRLSHPNIVKAHKLDHLGTTFFMVMELLKGVPLDEFIKTCPNGLSLTDAEPIIKDMAHALAYAHQEGLAHLDFKPANVFYDPEAKSVKVIDFGIARPLEQSEREKTGFDPGALGALTNAYASYEMLLSLDPDQRDDIYALACVAYELLSGKHPFNRQKATTAKYEKLSPEPIEGLKRQQEQTLLRGLAFYRDDRTPTVDKFLAELFPEKKKSALGLVGGGLVAAIVAGFVVWELFKEPAPPVAQGQLKIAAEQERQRLEEAARLAAEQEVARKQAEAARLAAEQEVARKQAEAARLAAEQEDARKQAEAARLAAEQEDARKQAEAARLAAEQEVARKQAEAARLAAEQEAAQLSQVARLLQECQKHLDGKRLTSGRGGTALDCYQDVLEQEPGNAEALDGLHKIELSYQNLAERAFRQKRLQKVPNYLKGFERVNPQSPILADLRERLKIERENLARQQEEAKKQQAEAERKAREKAKRRKAEAERQAREEAKRRKAEAERQAREEAKKRQAEAERKAREEAKRQQAEAERKAREEARKQQAEAERKAKQREEARKQQAEAERKAKQREEARRQQAEAKRKA
ncbi:MAG: protein kinase, partial [Pseudomonadota bacterium]